MQQQDTRDDIADRRSHEIQRPILSKTRRRKTAGTPAGHHAWCAGGAVAAAARAAAGVVRRCDADITADRATGLRPIRPARCHGRREHPRTRHAHADANTHTTPTPIPTPTPTPTPHRRSRIRQRWHWTGRRPPVHGQEQIRFRNHNFIIFRWRQADLGGLQGHHAGPGLSVGRAHRVRGAANLCKWGRGRADLPRRPQPHHPLVWHKAGHGEKARGGLDIGNRCHQRAEQLLARHGLDRAAAAGPLARGDTQRHEPAAGSQSEGFGGGHLPHARWQHLFPRSRDGEIHP